MAYQPKSYRKFLAGTVTTALVASAVAPVAGAEGLQAQDNHTTFTDVSPTDVHAPNIQKAVDLGLVSGYGNEFRPYNSVTRGQVALIISRWLTSEGVTVDTSETEEFADVPSTYYDEELYEASLVLRELGIFTGTQENNFNPTAKISRQAMAKVLVEAFDLQDLEDVDATVSDIEDAQEWAREYINILVENGVTVVDEFKPLNFVTRAQFSTFVIRAIEGPMVDEPGVVSIDFNEEGDMFTVEFTEEVPEGVTLEDILAMYDVEVNGTPVTDIPAEILEALALEIAGVEGNVVTFSHTDLDDLAETLGGTSVTLTIDGVDGVYTFDVAPEPGEYSLDLMPAKASIVANGADNTVITARVLDSNGDVATNADDLVLQFDTTYGSLANTRVTVQDGVATVLLTSEFSQRELQAIVSAKLIETAPDSEFANQIGELIDATTVTFTEASGDVIVTNPPVLSGAETNQADRVTLYFDKNVTPDSFLRYSDANGFVVDEDGDAIFDAGAQISISQDGEATKGIRGIKSVAGNPRALEVILSKDTVLTDNKDVEVEVSFTNGANVNTSDRSFTFTDARRPEATSVRLPSQNLRNVEVTFSESIADVASNQVQIDGGIFSIDEVENGEFDQRTGIDNRNKLFITTDDFLTAGTHSVQLSGISDFAGLTDSANISTNQSLDFVVPANDLVPAFTVDVESPEQLRVEFNTTVSGFDASELVLQVWDEDAEQWVSTDSYDFDNDGDTDNQPSWTVTNVEDGNEFVYELEQDWTTIYDTNNTNRNYYNDEFRLVLAKDAVTNVLNGKRNAAQNVSLNYAGSALNSPDNASPTIVGSPSRLSNGDYRVTFNEPVKSRGLDNSDTPSQLQGGAIPAVVVEFIGTDEDGNTVTVDGSVVRYSSSDSSDNGFDVRPNSDLQDLVDADYDTTWTLVVRNVTDDVGNAATTLTQDFTVLPSPAAEEVFKVKDATYDGVDFFLNGDAADTIRLEFFSGVKFTGNVDNALNLSNYTLNGVTLPAGSIASLSDGDGNVNNGYEVVTITVPNGTLSATTNTINISKALTSATGVSITGLTEIAEAPATEE